jgi:hypothetical protein
MTSAHRRPSGQTGDLEAFLCADETAFELLLRARRPSARTGLKRLDRFLHDGRGVPPGECATVTGERGSGKSALLRALAVNTVLPYVRAVQLLLLLLLCVLSAPPTKPASCAAVRSGRARWIPHLLGASDCRAKYAFWCNCAEFVFPAESWSPTVCSPRTCSLPALACVPARMQALVRRSRANRRVLR